MGFVLFLLASISLSAQSLISVSPAGDTGGFALEPLIKLRFDGPINPDSLRNSVFIVWGATRQQDGFTTYPEGYRMPINNLAWDPATNTAYAKPDEPLDHDRDYSIVYNTLEASRFHTRNVTQTILARRLGPAASIRRSTAIDLAEVKSIQTLSQTAADSTRPLTDTGFPVDVSFLTQLGLRRLVFLSFESSRGDRVAVHAWLPNSPKPAAGWPVKLIGHGLFDSRFSGPTLFASAFIANSVVMSIDAVGHGYGDGSILRFQKNDGSTVDAPMNGRGRDINSDGRIDPAEGCILADFISTCLRETALDYQKLVREIQANIDLDGDRQPDLNPNSIQYLGQSLGAMYGTILMAIEPGIDAAVLNVGGGSAIETARTSTLLKPLLEQIVGVANDPLIPRHVPARRITTAQGQYLELLDRLSIAETTGAPASFAPFLKQATLYGNPIKRVLFQYAVGDQSVPNNSNGQLIRAAFENELVSVYRHDIARQIVPTLPENPHAYMAAFAQLDQPSLLIALATLSQASEFLASGRREVPDVNGLVRFLFRQNLFETPSLIP
jgi:hypothetical protein